jgi:hypothetical protein
MNSWLAIAFVAYLVGAVIEGVGTASCLSQSAAAPTEDSEASANHPNEPPPIAWKFAVAVTTVSLCGALFWPCRLVHRSLKSQDCQGE